jgi:uncharacterized protein DUF3618
MSADTPTDPQQLRDEIAQTRAELGDTVQALAAKTDVKARAKRSASDAAVQIRQKAVSAKDQALQAAAAVKDQVAQSIGGEAGFAERELPGVAARRPIPVAVFGGVAIVVLGLAVYLIRKRRS